MADSKRERIPGLYSRKTEGPTTMLFSFEGADAKSSIIGRRAQRPRRNIDLDKVSQVLRRSASDNLIAETGCFVFDSLFYGSQCNWFRRGLACYVLRDLSMSLAAKFCTCWSGLVIVCGWPASRELQKSNLDRMHELTGVWLRLW